MGLASHVALTRARPVLVASMEMGGSELMSRLTAAEASVNLEHLVRRKLTDDDWVKILKSSDRLQNAGNFILDDSPNLTLSKIRARIRWMCSRGEAPAMVVADYLQLMTPEGSSSTTNRAQEVATLSRGLKLLAMEFEIPVIALAQFNRGAAGRQPVVTDFKDSSAIEQDSNVIVLMHRPLAEDGSDTGPRAGEIDLIVAKNRNGASGRVVPLIFQGHYARLQSFGRD
jgi:replicative DNA helicase